MTMHVRLFASTEMHLQILP